MLKPARLTIVKGRLHLNNKANAVEYLQNWQAFCKIPDGTKVYVITETELKVIFNNQYFNISA